MAMEANLKLKLKLILPPTLEEKEFLSPLNMLMYFFFGSSFGLNFRFLNLWENCCYWCLSTLSFVDNFNFVKIVAPYFDLQSRASRIVILALVFREKNTLKVGLFFLS